MSESDFNLSQVPAVVVMRCACCTQSTAVVVPSTSMLEPDGDNIAPPAKRARCDKDVHFEGVPAPSNAAEAGFEHSMTAASERRLLCQ